MMKSGFFSVIAFMLAALAGALASAPAQAQAWPSRPVKFVAPYTPGGSTDNLSRLLAQKLSAVYKQSVIVENRPGAGGVVGSDFVAKSAPDGYTLLLSTLATQVIAPAIQKTPYDGLRDFTYVAMLGGPATTLSVGPGLAEVKDLKSFIALAKSKPNAIGYGTPGNGTHGHLVGELLKRLTGIEISHVPYKGGMPAVTDLVAGHVPAGVLTVASVGPHVRAGKLRTLASTAAKRVADFPEVPTFAELGYPELTSITWFGVAAPAGLPAAVVESLNQEIRKAMQAADVRERLRPEGFEFIDLDAAQTLEYVRAETRRWQPIAKASSARND
ncbi:MAG: tripartite tricarboxylate transporter substrate binding protein [Betaproteobacteria bacterium]|nr:tripartite tricarboxylate transporter substrate binding protein [Betaproteobacteria bacterium]